MYIQRKIELEIKKYLKTREVLALIGPRQSGKTTVLKKIFQEVGPCNSTDKSSFISFEDIDALSLFDTDIKNFAETYIKGNKYLFIDEFQYAKNGGKNLKYLFDTFETKIIISGSSAVDLTVQAIKYLVGRVFILEMHPFDFEEFLLAKDKNYFQLYLDNKIDMRTIGSTSKNNLAIDQMKIFQRYFNEYTIWGGYPRVVLSKTREEKKMVLKNIYNTYFLREVKTLMDIADDYQLEKIITMLGLQIGNLVEYVNFSNELGISFETIKKYVNFLEKTYICKLVKPFYKNKRKEIVKIPKVFFFDTGLRNVAINDFRLLNKRTDAGELLENAVWMQLNRQGLKTRYWRDKNQNEVDLILDLAEQKMIAIEVKKNLRQCKKFPKAFIKEHRESKNFCAFLELKKETKENNNVFIPML